ncbi:Peptidyl-prolyl cis-trans isomerase FKBP53 [Mucuna pruriens]|uniref:peptidylprolyl isomerase n=1 Tax=Mucuna pruriens TaxID=157652 RepID=A0A371GZB9_MUCPR|nr:Peptidyl-prolyl cis-trans isomerase FKBP53 [Mucuna pruriens]
MLIISSSTSTWLFLKSASSPLSLKIVRISPLDSVNASFALPKFERKGRRKWRAVDGSGENQSVTVASPARTGLDNDSVVDSASAVVRNFYGGINAHDVDSVQYLIAENCVYEDLVFPRPFVGRKEILEFFKKFTNSTSKDLQFVIDDLSTEDSSSVGVIWHLEWKGKPFPFSKGCSFYRLEVINGRRQITYGRDSVEPAIKPGDATLAAIRSVTWLLQQFPQLANWLYSGIEVKPSKPYPYHADNVRGKLHVTQATLGTGSSSEKSILQCSSGHKSPVFLCSLLPNTTESCPLNLEFDADDLVAFSVIGSRSIHLSGYFAADDGDDLRDDYEYDSWGEDIEGTESDESSEDDSEDDYADDFIVDSDVDMYPSSPVPNSGVVIEEIVDDENGDDPIKQLKKKKRVAQLKEKDSKSSDLVVESEDEDGFPISTAEKGVLVSQKAEAEIKGEQVHKKTEKAKKEKDVDHSASLKRKVDSADEDEPQDGKKKRKKGKKLKDIKGESAHASGSSNEANVAMPDEKHPEEDKTATNLSNVSHAEDEHDGKLPNNEDLAEKKKKKKKKKKTNDSEGVAAADQIATTVEKQNLSSSEKKGKKQTETKPSQVRTFSNGLVIEEVYMGKPDGKKAAPGKKVSVKYIGKLKKDGKIFDSNVGSAPFKFRLGVGQVIKGWEIGINGMRIGDKRKITIPPSMGYSDKRVGSIPPNSWLVFDVELINVDG